MEKLTVNKASEVFQRPDWVGKTSMIIVIPFVWIGLTALGIIGLIAHTVNRLYKKVV